MPPTGRLTSMVVNSEGWKARFEVDGPPLVMLLSSRSEGAQFTRLERHFGVTQTFIPLGQVPSVVAMAAPTAPTTRPRSRLPRRCAVS